MDVGQAAPPGFPAMAGTAPAGSGDVNPQPGPLPQLTVVVKPPQPPPQGCDGSIRFGYVVDGATVQVDRGDGTTEREVSATAEKLFYLASPVPPGGETLRATQLFPECRQSRPSPPLVVTAAAAAKPPVPDVTPPCAGAPFVLVDGLWGGSAVTVTVNGTAYAGDVGAGEGHLTCQVDPLPPGASVSVTQEHCGQASDPATVTADALGVSTRAELAGPVFACSRVVRARKAQAGALVQVWGVSAGVKRPISPKLPAKTDSFRVKVFPYPVAGDDVWVEQLACEGGWAPSPTVPVVAPPSFGTVEFQFPPIEGDNYVTPKAAPGAYVEVYNQTGPGTKEFLGAGDVDPDDQTVWLARPLTLADHPFAVQALCTRSEGVRPADVLPAARTFTLAGKLSQLSPVNSPTPKSVVVDSASLTCRHDGTWDFTAHARNEETEADVSLAIAVTVGDGGGATLFGATQDGQLSAQGDGPVTLVGLRTLGVPSQDTFAKHELFVPFRDPAAWPAVVDGATAAKFTLPTVAWMTYAPPPDEPDEPPGDD